MRVQMILEAIDRASRPIRAVMNSLIGVERAAQASSGITRVGQGLTQVGARVGAMAAISSGAAIGLASSMLGTASAFEKMETALITTEGSQKKARQAMAWVSDFATKTPYELAQVNEAFVALRNRGLDPTNGMMKTLGDTSAALGTPLMSAVEAMADAVTGENERLKTFGITTAVDTAARQVSYTYSDLAGVMHTVTAKMGDQADIANKLSGIFNSKFAGSMERLSATWEGTVNNLRDAWTRFQLAIMDAGLFDWMRDKAQELLRTVNAMAADGRLAALAKEVATTIKQVLVFTYELVVGIKDAIVTIAPYIAALVDNVGGVKNAMLLLGGVVVLGPIFRIVSGIGMLMSAFTPLAPVLLLAARAFLMFGAAIMATPVGWVMAAIALIAGGAYLIYQNWAKIGPWLAAIWGALKSGMVLAWNGMVNWVSSVGGRMLSAVQSGWNSFTAWISGIGTSTVNMLSTGWAAVTGWFSSLTWPSFPKFQLLDNLKTMLDPVLAFVEGWGTLLYDAFDGAISKVSAFIDGAAQTIGGAFSKITDALSWGEPTIAGPTVASVAASAAEIETVNKAASTATKMVQAIAPAASEATAAASGILSGVSFYSHGLAMMTTLATGIRAGASAAVAAAAATVKQIRDYLPHSPAKVGPLSDLDKVQFSQTLATAITAGAPRALMAVRTLTAGLAAALPSSHAYAFHTQTAYETPAFYAPAAPTAPSFTKADLPQFARPTKNASPSQSVSGGQNITINLTLNPTFNGTSSADFLDQLRAALPNIGYELAQALRSELDRTARTQH